MSCPRWGSNPRPRAILRFPDERLIIYFIIIIPTLIFSQQEERFSFRSMFLSIFSKDCLNLWNLFAQAIPHNSNRNLSPYIVYNNHLKSKEGARIISNLFCDLGKKVVGADLGLSAKKLQAMTHENIDTRVDEALSKRHPNLTPNSDDYCDAANLRKFVLHLEATSGTDQMLFRVTACLLPFKIDDETYCIVHLRVVQACTTFHILLHISLFRVTG